MKAQNKQVNIAQIADNSRSKNPLTAENAIIEALISFEPLIRTIVSKKDKNLHEDLTYICRRTICKEIKKYYPSKGDPSAFFTPLLLRDIHEYISTSSCEKDKTSNSVIKDFNKKKGITFKNQFLIVFCPKYRRKVLVGNVATRLIETLYLIAENKEVQIMSLIVKPDYVQMIISMDTRLTLHKVIKEMKNESSSILRTEFPELKKRIPSLWTRNYLSCSMGSISEDEINKYIESQQDA